MPKNGPQYRGGNARSIALGGMLSALAVVVLLAGGLIPIGTFAAPIFAGICLIPVAIDIGTKWALLCYLAVGALAALVVPDWELVLFFILLCGWYPIVWPTLNKIKYAVARWAVKLLLFNAAVAAVYAILYFLLTPEALQSELAQNAWWFWAALLAGGNLTFVVYDVMLHYVRLVYTGRIRKYLFRGH